MSPVAVWDAPATEATLLTTELDALANSAASALSAEQDPSTQTPAFPMYGCFTLDVDYDTAPTEGSPVELYIVRAPDGTNYEDYTSGATEVLPPDGRMGAFQVRAVTTAQRIVLDRVPLPPFKWKVGLFNGTGQAFDAAGNTLKIRRYTEESV